MNRSVLNDVLAVGALACVFAGACLSDPLPELPPPPHSEQGDFRMVIVTADGDCWGFLYELDGLEWLDAHPDVPVVYAGPWDESCMFWHWFPRLVPSFTEQVISGSCEG